MRVHMDRREYKVWGYKEPFWLFPCIYCGEPSLDEIDHIPPSSIRSRLIASNAKLPKMWEVDCCRECNSALSGSQALWSVDERKEYVANWLLKRYKKLLKMPNWTKQELESMNPKFRKRIMNSLRRKDRVRSRLEWANSK